MPPKQKPSEDYYSLKETSPDIGGKSAVGGNDKLTLVEQRQFLYVRIVRAIGLPPNNVTGTCDPFVELRIGNYKGTTRYFEQSSNPEWNQVFAFTKERLQGAVVEVLVRDKEFINDQIIGRVLFNLGDVPSRFPPDSPLAPQWYRLEDRNGVKVAGELMLAVWIGNQADDAFSIAWHSDAAAVSGENVANTRSKVYHSPRLWYLRIHLIGAQDLMPADRNRKPEAYVKAILGNLVLRSRVSQDKNLNPSWNEELMFVAAEPFDDPLILSVEDKVTANKEECLGRSVIPLQQVEKRFFPPSMGDQWINLERYVIEGQEVKEVKFACRLHLRIFLDGVYHVFDEPTYYSSDLRATSPNLWPEKIGILELGILKAEGLPPIKNKAGRGTIDAYCVAKYGHKWVRTTTMVDNFAPVWNEQYYWDVYDPYTVITIGVFDNNHLAGEGKNAGKRNPSIGKVRIRLSTLETGRIYTHAYPLIVLEKDGLKKMGELHLAVKFTCTSLINLVQTYTQPLLPMMHYLNPLSVYQLDLLRHQATYILALKLGRADPPLRKEVVEYMLDTGANKWSLRKGKANVERIMICLSGFVAFWRWFDKIRKWNNPAATILILLLYIVMVINPHLILPTFFFTIFVAGVLHFPKRPRNPPHMDTRLSHAENAASDDLDEEFDTFPSSKTGEVLKARYDRLRGVAGKLMLMTGDLATQLERVQALVSWRDPRATLMFLVFCLVAGCLVHVVPFKWLVILTGTYIMRHPRLRMAIPSFPQNFLRRLPARMDSML
ncbi:FT-interacting protein 3 [Turnera subulata]|uniref:FT-interacting protein 3 n=1 Tax=Turnera subulata TaxID=218843 RepID=A0A9Q0J8S7_9ROSI|nr:FT-interacting protein 3 [Turnera subulata]